MNVAFASHISLIMTMFAVHIVVPTNSIKYLSVSESYSLKVQCKREVWIIYIAR